MTIDRDDPERGSLAENPASPERQGFSRGDQALFDWALDSAGASLLRDGLSFAAIVKITRDVVHVYARFRKSVRRPRQFVVQQLTARAKRYMELRDIQPRTAVGERALEVLAGIGTKEALATLTVRSRRILEMLFLERKSLEEAAAELDMSVAAVERQARRAVARLRQSSARSEPES